MKQTPGIAKKIIFSLTPLLLIFFSAEIILRLLGFHYYPAWTYNDPRWERDPYLIYKLKPNFISNDGSIRINSFGFRGEEFSIKKDKNIIRIVCMGDSCTFGFGIKWTSYPDELQRLLGNNSKRKRYEVINAGVPDYSSFQGLRLLERRILRLKPDIITISYGWNDIRRTREPPDKDQGTNPYWFFIDNLFHKSRVYQGLGKAINSLKRKITENKKSRRKLVHRVSPSDFKNNLETMVKLAKSSEIKVFLLTQPQGKLEEPIPNFLKQFLKDRNLYNNIIRTVSQQLQVPVIDMEAVFKDRNDDRLFDDTKKDLIHPNLEGLKLTAYEIYKACISMN